MSSINQKLGIKPRTKLRQATHAAALATGFIRCPECGCGHVLRTQSSNGRLLGDFMCALCSHFFSVAVAPVPA